MFEEYPSNSHRPVPPKEGKKPPVEEPKLDPVVTGKVIRRKKSLGRRFLDTFFSGDSSVVSYLGKEVLLPAVQNLVIDFVTQGIEKAVTGEVRSPRRTSRGSMYTNNRTYTSYDRPSSIIRTSRSDNSSVRRSASTRRAPFELDEIILESMIAAEVIADNLLETLEKYETVTVANLKELLDESPVYTDHKYGWTDLSGLKIKRVRDGYLLDLPDVEDLRD